MRRHTFIFIMTAALAFSAPALADSGQSNRLDGASRYFGNIVLIDQDGRRLRFYDDLLAGRVAVINGFFGGCTASCPVVLSNLAALHERLAIEGIDASFVSITVDPDGDTPERLPAIARRFGVSAGWHLLSGPPDSVRQVLSKLGLAPDPGDPADHLSVLYVANLRTGLWVKAFSTAPVDDLMSLIVQTANDSGSDG
jgi:cytochrome oxidase Cu insertion factor (SCO1/SenC/PrrC family)